MDFICGVLGPRNLTNPEDFLGRVTSAFGKGNFAEHSCNRLVMGVGSGCKGDVGRPPPPLFTSEDGAVTTAVIGDVVNHEEARARLQTLGCLFHDPRSIPELIYHIHRHGDRALFSALEGVFCIAIWDTRAEQLTLIPDRNGIRPFYYHASSEHLVFSTSLKGVLAHSSVPRRFNTSVLYELLRFGVVLPPDTLMRDVRMVRGGEFLEFSNASPRIKANAPGGNGMHVPDRPEDRVEQYFQTLERSVLACLSGKSRPGLLLSGGIDSGAIASIANRNSIELKSYTIDFSDDLSELNGARVLSDFCNTRHHETTSLSPRYMELFPEAVWFSETAGGISVNCVTEMLLGQAVDTDHDVVLTGDGNDLIWGIFNPPADALEKPGKSFPALYGRFRTVVPRHLVRALLRKAHHSNAGLHDKIEKLRPDTGILFNDLLTVDRKVYGQNAPNQMIGRLRLDPSAIAYRFPYLDTSLIKLIEALPVEEKFTRADGRSTTKVLMRRAMRDLNILPDAVIDRRKDWMHSPARAWLLGDSGKIVERIILNRSASICNYIERHAIRSLWTAHRKGMLDASVPLMMLVALEVWHRLFIETTSIEKPELSLSEMF